MCQCLAMRDDAYSPSICFAAVASAETTAWSVITGSRVATSSTEPLPCMILVHMSIARKLALFRREYFTECPEFSLTPDPSRFGTVRFRYKNNNCEYWPEVIAARAREDVRRGSANAYTDTSIWLELVAEFASA